MGPSPWHRSAALALALLAAPLALSALAHAAPGPSSAPVAQASPLCGNGVVDPGEECDPCDPNVPVEGTDRYNLCNCDCKLRTRAVPFTVKMGAFYLLGGLAILGLRGSFSRLRGPSAGRAWLRMVAALLLGPVLIVWGLLEWVDLVKPPMQASSGVLFSAKRQGGSCTSCPPNRR